MILTNPDEPTRHAILRLLNRVEDYDGVAAVGEEGTLGLRSGTWKVSHAVVKEGPAEDVVAYGWSDGTSGEIAVDPANRRAGLGTKVAKALLAEHPGTALWAHRDGEASRGFAKSLGLRQVRDLRYYVWETSGGAPAVGELPDGYVVGAFEGDADGRDASEFLEANALIFADHPEQGRFSQHDLALRMAEPWFDAERFLLVRTGARGERATGGKLAAFGWTKPGEDLDEVFLVGVHPDHEGKGLASWLVRTAQAETVRLGKKGMSLYVEADNPAALTAYERAGFVHRSSDIQYSL